MDDNVQRIADLIAQDRKLEAVKLLRETTGMDLQRAVEEVERLSSETGEPAGAPAPAVPGEIPAEVRELALQGKKIEAIKLLRERSRGLGLKEAKDLVETIPGVPKGSGCAAVVLISVLVLLLAAVAI